MELHDAASRLGVHYQTAKWVRDGSLVAVKRGATYEVSTPTTSSAVASHACFRRRLRV